MTFTINKCIVAGKIGEAGPKLIYTAGGKPECKITLLLEKHTADRVFRSFVPICILGEKAELLADALEPGDLVCVSGELSFKGDVNKGGLCVVAFAADVLMKAGAAVN